LRGVSRRVSVEESFERSFEQNLRRELAGLRWSEELEATRTSSLESQRQRGLAFLSK
jgi:hypothetical protein